MARAIGLAVGGLRRRHRPKLTQEDLGFATGFDRSYISALERGDHDPRASTLFRLADGLEISFGRFADEIARRYKD